MFNHKVSKCFSKKAMLFLRLFLDADGAEDLNGLFHPVCLVRVVSWLAFVVAILMAHEFVAILMAYFCSEVEYTTTLKMAAKNFLP